jgi:hypothetical protein
MTTRDGANFQQQDLKYQTANVKLEECKTHRDLLAR